jgi:hypothetical protein
MNAKNLLGNYFGKCPLARLRRRWDMILRWILGK